MPYRWACVCAHTCGSTWEDGGWANLSTECRREKPEQSTWRQVRWSSPGSAQSRCLELGSVDNVGGLILWDGGCPVHCRLCNSILPPPPLEARSTLPNSCQSELSPASATCSLGPATPGGEALLLQSLDTSCPWTQIRPEESGAEGL